MEQQLRSLNVSIVHSEGSDASLAFRTRRRLMQLGIPASSIRIASEPHFVLPEDTDRPLWIVDAGCWPVTGVPRVPPSSSTGFPVVAVGAIKQCPRSMFREEEATQWDRWLQTSGGDFSSKSWLDDRAAPRVRSLLLTPNAIPLLRGKLNLCQSLRAARIELLNDSAIRLIRSYTTDCYFDSQLRVTQVITSLQRGGAERLAIDLHRQWLGRAMHALLIAMGNPTRKPFPAPVGSIELGNQARREHRMDLLLDQLNRFQPDVVHVHLLSAEECRCIREQGYNVLATLHNMRPGWPRGYDSLTREDVDLIVACSKAVEQEFQGIEFEESTENKSPPRSRTVWNGIDTALYCKHSEDRKQSRSFEEVQPLRFLSLANPRPQKRMWRLPEILAWVERILNQQGRAVPSELWIAGEPAHGNKQAVREMESLKDQMRTHGVEDRVQFLGAVEDIPSLLHSVDVLVSTSLHEGLSLAHLEALASGVPVVASDVGGTCEIGDETEGVWLVPLDATAETYAEAWLRAADRHRAIRPTISLAQRIERDFSLVRMSEGYLRQYRFGLPSCNPIQSEGLVLISNNFSVGGAQTSARRLLTGLHAKGVRVRAAVIQECAESPTRGTQRLREAGIEVQCLGRLSKRQRDNAIDGDSAVPDNQYCNVSIDPWQILQPLLHQLVLDPPQAIALWNVIPEYKALIVDALPGFPIHDVSPGEMNLQSLDRYFSSPRPGLPVRNSLEYGSRLASAIVKYHGESSIAEARFKTKIHVIPNGVPIPEQPVRVGKRERWIVGTACRIHPQKRLEDLIEAVRIALPNAPEFELRIAGGADGESVEYAKRLRRQSEGLPVKWIGEQSDIDAFLRDLDLFAMISEPAGCPNALLEALAMGLPVVATDRGGASEQCRHLVNGLLVPARDNSAMAQAIIHVLSDEIMRYFFAVNSRKIAVESFSIERMVEDYRKVFGLE